MKKLSDIVIELGKVQTAKDNPPFKTPKQIEKEAYGFNSGARVKVRNPVNQKYDFSKPTLVNISKEEIMILVKTGRIEVDGITILYEK
tara:strand:- start:1515 stop:1778 length:264 start_codon:yes stop_codon:yes gene_type:complete